MSSISPVNVTAAVHSVSNAQPDSVQSAASIEILKKSMDAQETSMTQLLSALPQPPLATSGSLGRHVNTYA